MRRAAFIIVAGWLAVAGCGSEEPTATAGGAPAETRTVEHALGTTVVPGEVERLMVLDATLTLGYVVSLGVWPAAAMSEAPPGAPRFPPGLGPRTADIEAVPGPEVDLEAVAAARPQLIIAETSYIEPVYEQLSQIAPTVAVELAYRPFEDLRRLAEILGRPDAAQRARQRVEGALEVARKRLGSCGSVSITGVRTDGTLRLYDPEGYFPAIAARELGCALRPTFDEVGAELEPGAIADVSAERTAAFDGDHLFLIQDPGDREEQEQVNELLADPLFGRLPAALADQVVELDQLDALGSAGVSGWLRTLERMVTTLERGSS